MDLQPLDALAYWRPGWTDAAQLQAIRNNSSMSGAELWRVTGETNDYCLRAWREETTNIADLARIHALQIHLARVGPRVTPVPEVAVNGNTFYRHNGRLWELTSWRPGQSHTSQPASSVFIKAACVALARVHIAAAQHEPTTRSLDPSPALIRRKSMAERLLSRDLAELQSRLEASQTNSVRLLLERGLQLAELLLPAVLGQLAATAKSPLPLQWRLTDVRREHVLFSGQRVTGIVDFGAADVDTPAGDLARLLGEMAENRPTDWAAGIQAYEQIRPLCRTERIVLQVLDASGVCLAICRWAAWILDFDSAVLHSNESAVENRIRWLVGRADAIAASPIDES